MSDSMMEFYDSLFRFWAVGIFSLMGLLILRDYGMRFPVVVGALSTFSAAGYLLISQPGGYDNWGLGFYPLAALGAIAPASVWLFGLTQFQDNFRLERFHAFVLLAYAVIWFFGFAQGIGPDVPDLGPIEILGTFVRFALIGHIVYVAWQGREDDLLESRRKFRTAAVLIATGFTAVIVLVETSFQELRFMPEVALFQAFAFLLFGLLVAWYGLRTEQGILIVEQSRSERQARAAEAEKHIDATDRHDLDEVRRLIVGEAMYLQPGLTISGLADAASIPEHRLRKLINRTRGYRNFSDFLNRYRIEEAQKRLADPENRHVQVLVIAMDLGYGSLGPFNRAFKERTGKTPTEFRKQALADFEN
jgi:AraC-like DNA-binding protein